MKIDINGSYAKLIEDDSLIQNSTKPYTVIFTFDETWEGFAKTALFEAGNASIAVVLTGDKCTIPAECLKTAGVRLKTAVYGVRGEERISTGWCTTGLIMYQMNFDAGRGGCCGGGSSLPDDVYEQIMAAIGDLSAAGFEGMTLAEVFREIKNSVCGTATDEEVSDALNDIFGKRSELPGTPGETESQDNTATDKEIGDILDDVFGKKP